LPVRSPCPCTAGHTAVSSPPAGFLLLLLMELGIKLSISPQLLYWHVELGVTLALVTVFHIHTYWKSA